LSQTSEIKLPIIERIAEHSLLAKLPPAFRTPFALGNLFFFSGNFLGGLVGFIYQALLAKFLGRDGFAEVAPLLSIFYLLQILMYVAMAVSAKLTSPLFAQKRLPEIHSNYQDLLRYAIFGGIAGMLLFWGLSPLMASFLKMNNIVPLLILGTTIPLAIVAGVVRGTLQGDHRFFELSLTFFAFSFVTLIFLPIILMFNLGTSGAMVGVGLGMVVSDVIGLVALRALAHSQEHPKLSLLPLVKGAVVASAGITAITLFYNCDVLLAKHYLSISQAGLYSGMALLGKILFFGTLSVSGVMFPRVASLHAEGKNPHKVVNISLGLVLVAGGAVVGLYTLFPSLIIHLLLRGDQYIAIGRFIGLYAFAMLALAISNVLVYYFVGVHEKRFIWGLLIGGLAFLILVLLNHQNFQAVTIAVTIAISLMAIILVVLYALEKPHLAFRESTRAMLDENLPLI
jgi:O-antigen/teichoic acid export membrane protein